MEDKDKHIVVIGDGSWATSLVKIFTENGVLVDWYIRKQETIDHIKKTGQNPEYLSNVKIDITNITFFNSVEQAIKHSNIILFVLPSEFLPDLLETFSTGMLKYKFVISAIKGIIEEEDLTVCNYLNEIHHVPMVNMCVISGPSHAEEVSMEKLSYLTVASKNEELAKLISSKLERPYVKTIQSDDMVGTEYAAVLKNIMAVCSGICDGLGYGDNFQAVLVSNAIREIKRFTKAVHPIKRDINESAYLGDLMVTAYSELSRNRTFGKKIGQGEKVEDALDSMTMIAEGYHSTECIYNINKKINADLPITEAVYNILFCNASPESEIQKLTEKLR